MAAMAFLQKPPLLGNHALLLLREAEFLVALQTLIFTRIKQNIQNTLQVWNSYKDINELAREISVEFSHSVRTNCSLSGGMDLTFSW